MRGYLFLCAYFCGCLLLIYPNIIFAQGDDLLLLSEKDSKLILREIQAELTKQGTLNFPFLKPEEQVAIFLARDASRKAVFDFLPWFITTETIQTVIKVANFAKRIPELTVKDFFEELESKSVQEAVKLGTDWLFQNEIRFSSGEIQGSYLSYWGGQSQVKFQYLMTYIANAQSSGNLVFEFYSADQIDPPAQSSVGFPWEIGDWLTQRKKKLDPFVVHIDTRVMKSGLGWILDSSVDTKITVEFPEKVPRLQLAKEWPYPLEEQKIKLLNYWTTAKKIIDFLRSASSETLEKVKDIAQKAQGVAKEFSSFITDIISRGGAGVVLMLPEEKSSFVEEVTQENGEAIIKEAERVFEKLDQITQRTNEPVVNQSDRSSLQQEMRGREIQKEVSKVGTRIQNENTKPEKILDEDQTKLSLVKDEANSVENLTELSFPQIQQEIAEVQLKLVSIKKEAIKEEKTLDLVKDTMWCVIDPTREPVLSGVILYEIAWMGGANSANDEWMRLKNISNSEVNLAGWQLQDADNQIQIAFGKEYSILSQGTFVLERTNDDSLPGTKAQLIYTGALNNTEEALYLFDEKCVLRDKVVASPDWLAGDSVARKPMERSSDVTYPKILISEVQTAGISSQIEEFVELYNPTNERVDLTDWYIQKKTQEADSFSTFVSKNLLSGKTIQASGYFLIAREGSSFAPIADAVTSYSLGDNNTLAMKNPNGEIVDKIAWGDVQDAENAPAPNPSAGQSLNRIWNTVHQTYYDRDNNSIDFAIHNPTSPKAVNYEDRPSSPTPPSPSPLPLPPPPSPTPSPPQSPPPLPAQDTTLPQATLASLTSSQSNIYFSLAWAATDPTGDVLPSGLQNIFLEYSVTPSAAGVFVQYNNNGVWTNWQQGATGKLTLNPQTATLNLLAQDDVSYTFQIQAKDVAGNESAASSASTAVSLARTVIINEIAWGGTKAESTDEWLELLNTTSSLVDVTGWKITSSDSGGPEITLSGTIAANGFYLIERTDDQATSAVANLTAAFGDGLSNTICETLYLHNTQDTVIDQTMCKSDGSWPAGKASPDYTSMERIVSTSAGSNMSNWASNNLIQYNSKDVANNWVNGTPGKANSTATSPTTITELRFDEFSTMTLTLLGSPYISPTIIIPASKTLIVEPGVQVKFQDNAGRLTVQGTLKAQGTQANGITFTVTDLGALWCGINVTSTSSASQLDYVTIDKAQSLGGGCNVSYITYSMYVESSAVTINNSVIQTGAGYRKLYLKNSNSVINALTVSGATLNAESVGIYIDGGSPTISNSTISNNSIGILVNSLSNNPTIQNNTFTGNTHAVKLDSAGALLSGNTATSNTYNGVFVEGMTQANTVWQKDAIPYIINKFTVSAGTTLTIQAGVAVKFINTPSTESQITVQGTLITQGTQANPVVFTAAGDNTVGGSNSYTGGGITTTWKRIYIAPGSTGSQLGYTTLRYGGNTYYEAALYVKQSSVQVSNLTISDSIQSAIYSFDGAITGSGVTLSNNTYGFHIQTGDCPALSAVTVTGTLLHPSSSVCSF